MNRTGSVITGVALAAMLGVGLTATGPSVGLGMASAQDRELSDLYEPLRESASDQFFRVRWNAKPNPHGAGEEITGDVFNSTGRAAEQLQLRVIALDASGNQIGSFVEQMFGSVPPHNRTYFFIGVPVQAASYRLAVDTFAFVEAEFQGP
jgi:hypothetical protein